MVIDDLCDALMALHVRVASYGRQIAALAKDDPNIARLQTIPGVGPITASAIAATIGSAISSEAAGISRLGSAERHSTDPAAARNG